MPKLYTAYNKSDKDMAEYVKESHFATFHKGRQFIMAYHMGMFCYLHVSL